MHFNDVVSAVNKHIGDVHVLLTFYSATGMHHNTLKLCFDVIVSAAFWGWHCHVNNQGHVDKH